MGFLSGECLAGCVSIFVGCYWYKVLPSGMNKSSKKTGKAFPDFADSFLFLSKESDWPSSFCFCKHEFGKTKSDLRRLCQSHMGAFSPTMAKVFPEWFKPMLCVCDQSWKEMNILSSPTKYPNLSFLQLLESKLFLSFWAQPHFIRQYNAKGPWWTRNALLSA